MRQLIALVRANEKKMAWIFLGMILSQYAFSLAPELNEAEPYPDYYMYLVPFYETCSLDRFEHFHDQKPYRNFLKSWLNCASYHLGNDRILPVLFSIGCVYLTYLLGHSMSKDRIIGLIAAAALALNPLLTKFDSSPTYDQAWAFFFLLSMVLLFRMPKLSPLAYPLAIFSKVYAVGFLPLYLYTAYRHGKQRRFVMAATAGVVLVGISSVLILGVGTELGFHPDRLEESGERIFEVIWIVLPILVLFFGLDMIFKGHYNEARGTVLLWLVWIMLTIPLVYVFSMQWMFGYRFVPFAAFLSIYVGMTAVKVANVLLAAKLGVKNKPASTLR